MSQTNAAGGPARAMLEQLRRASPKQQAAILRDAKRDGNDLVSIAWEPPSYQPYVPFAQANFQLSATGPGITILLVVAAVMGLDGDVHTLSVETPNAANTVLGQEILDARWQAGDVGKSVGVIVAGYASQNGQASQFTFSTTVQVQPGATPPKAA